MLRRNLLDTAVLKAVLEGLDLRRERVEAQIAQLQSLLARRRGPVAAPAAKPKRTISAAGRKRMAAAQRKRWAALKEAREASAPEKRRLSAEGPRDIIEATRKRWAGFRAKQAAKGAKAAAKKA